MEWTKERIKELRLKMGWSHSDMARHLEIEVNTISEIENGDEKEFGPICSKLTLFWNQAESISNEVILSALAEQVLESQKLTQLFQSELQDKYLD